MFAGCGNQHKAYVALQRGSPATGYQIAKDAGLPRSMIYEVLGKLVARGAAFTQSFGDMVRYAPVPPDLLLDRMRHEFEDTLDKLGDGFKQLASLSVVPGQAWNVTGRSNILAQARQMGRYSTFMEWERKRFAAADVRFPGRSEEPPPGAGSTAAGTD